MVSDGDIYAVSLDIPPPKVLVINGLVIDEDNNPVAADIDLIQVETRRTMGKSKSNARTGEYSFSLLRKEGKYRLIARAPERRTIDSLFEVTPKSKDALDFVLIMKTPQKTRPVIIASLDKDDLRKGEIFRIDKLQFDANSAVIKETFYPLLDQMAEVLSRRDKLRIEIGGHTNINPEHDFCDRLSEARALAVYNYLRQKGVPEKNLMYKGYGKRNPIAPDTEYGRQLNQRVEIKVL
jgi:outer membrane protein OmpA-like peptidoglycan-associated protein